MVSRRSRRFVAVAVGLLADRLVAEPPNEVHPVALYGRAMTALEHRIWADARHRGAGYTAVGALVPAALGALVRTTAVSTTAVVAGAELRRVASHIANALENDDLEAARAALPSLVGRDPSALDASGIAAAAIESVAENTVDAVVAPVLWAAVAGAPGALAYRGVNTMDAMVGHRSERYAHFGTASARLDDLANWVPARVTAALFAAASPGRAADVARIVGRDASAHPSPNAGVAESAMAAVLGRRLGGPLRYGDRHEVRPELGDGPRPEADDLRRAIDTASRAETLLACALVAVAVMGWRR